MIKNSKMDFYLVASSRPFTQGQVRSPYMYKLCTKTGKVGSEKVYFNLYIVDEDSAAYDACIVVENPSNKREVRSTYDNIPEIPEESTYKALDPTTREPAGQYQSLVKPENEVSYDCCCTVHFIMIYITI